MAKLPVVAVVGRPNVGKSTFFNRVIGQRLAIVEDRPGVTRDRNFARAEWNGRHFYIVDTGGMVEGSDEPMDRLIRQQVVTAIAESDVVVHMVDGRAGPHPLDYAIAAARIGRFEEAGERIAAVAREEPRNARAWTLLCTVARRYDSDLAVTACARARALAPPVPRGSLNRRIGRSMR